MFGGTSVRIADLSRLNVKYPFIAFMPQWDFLNFLARAAASAIRLAQGDDEHGSRPI